MRAKLLSLVRKYHGLTAVYLTPNSLYRQIRTIIHLLIEHLIYTKSSNCYPIAMPCINKNKEELKQSLTHSK